MRPSFEHFQYRGSPNTTAPTDHQKYSAAELGIFGHAAKLGFFESPILDAECLAQWKRDVIMKTKEVRSRRRCPPLRQRRIRAVTLKRRCASHHMDGIDEEFSDHASFFRSLAKRKKPHAGNDDHRRIRVAHCRRGGFSLLAIIVRVIGAIFFGRCAKALLERCKRICFGIITNKQRLNARAQEMIRAACAEFRQFRSPSRAGKLKDVGGGMIMGDGSLSLAKKPSHHREQCRRNFSAIFGSAGRRASEPNRALAACILVNELAELIDNKDTVRVALFLRRTPGKQAMACQDDSVGIRNLRYSFAEHQTQLERRPLTCNPEEFAPKGFVEFLQPAAPIRAGRQGNRPIGMQMIYVWKRQKTVQRGIN